MEKEFFTLLSVNRISWGFVSGAESASAKFVLEKRLKLESPPLIAMGDAPDKPDPQGFLYLASNFILCFDFTINYIINKLYHS